MGPHKMAADESMVSCDVMYVLSIFFLTLCFSHLQVNKLDLSLSFFPIADHRLLKQRYSYNFAKFSSH